jgi:hypothetical protein
LSAPFNYKDGDGEGRRGRVRLGSMKKAMPRVTSNTLSKRSSRRLGRGGASAVARDVAGHVEVFSSALGRGLRHLAAAASSSPPPHRAAWARSLLQVSGGRWPFDGTVFMGDLNYRVRLPPSTNVSYDLGCHPYA